jgi:hypothetical protein
MFGVAGPKCMRDQIRICARGIAGPDPNGSMAHERRIFSDGARQLVALQPRA